jgi:hypothetical protein
MTPQSNWQHLAEQVSEEMDSAKLMTLVSKLCHAIDSDRQEKLHPHMINGSPAICNGIAGNL